MRILETCFVCLEPLDIEDNVNLGTVFYDCYNERCRLDFIGIRRRSGMTYYRSGVGMGDNSDTMKEFLENVSL